MDVTSSAPFTSPSFNLSFLLPCWRPLHKFWIPHGCQTLSSFSTLGYTSEPTNLNLYRRSRHFTCPPFLSRFGAVKPYFPFFVSPLAVNGFVPSLLLFFKLLL